MPKASVSHFKPGFKQLGYRSPHWNITNYFGNLHARFKAHPLYQKLSSPPWHKK